MFGKQYPVRNGIAVHATELELPDSKLYLGNEQNWDNHHDEYTARMFGRCILLHTLRSLDSLQEPVPRDVHSYQEKTYAPPELPTVRQAMDYIDDAYNRNERLRFGSLLHPEFRELGDTVMQQCIDNYNSFKNHTNSNLW
jgi:hypothetical protein